MSNNSFPRQVLPDANIVFFPYAVEDTSSLRSGKISNTEKMKLFPEAGISAQKDIIQIRTTKPKGGAGSWSCMLGSRVNWKGILHSGCWCMIYMSDIPLNGKETSEMGSGLKMLGIVKSVRRVEALDPATGTRTVRFMVSGTDFHSVFETPIYLNVNLNDVAKSGSDVSIANALLVLDKGFGNVLTPDKMVKTLVDSLLGKPAFNAGKSGSRVNKLAFVGRGGQPYLIPKEVAKRVLGYTNSGSAGDFFTGMVTFFLQNNLVGTTSLQSDIGRLVSTWSLIQTFCHRILNETYTDLLPVNVPSDTGTSTRLTPSIVLRAIPFSTDKSLDNSVIAMKDAKELVVLTRQGAVADPGVKIGDVTAGTGAHFYISRSIPEADILEFSSGKTDTERFNLFYVPPNLSLLNDQQRNEASFLRNIINLAGGKFENIGDTTSIARYGLRPYIAYSDYFVADSNKVIGKTNKIVQDLWATAHMFENGQVTVPGRRTHIPVGTNIEFTERKWIAHVEQVDNSYDVSPNGNKTFRTMIAFVRLQTKEDGKPVDAVEDKHTTGQVGTWDRGLSTI